MLTTRRCAVLGSPIGHSLSPVLHRAGYAAVGLEWTYDAVEVGEAGLAGFLDSLDGTWRGLSLTMPLKRAVVPLVDELTDRAVQARAANTVILDGGRRVGHNTDIPGAVAAITERFAGPLDRAVVLGGGATAASALLALADLGCRSATLVARNPDRAGDTLAAVNAHQTPPTIDVVRFGSPVVPGDIVVSTIPAEAQSVEVLALAESASVVFDVVYDPWPTPLAAQATSNRQPLVSGLDLLVHQAALQFTLMTEVSEPPLAAMRAAGEAALATRQPPS